MKSMSIIGLVLFGLSLLVIILCFQNNPSAAASWGILSILYGIPLAIVGLVKSCKRQDSKSDIYQVLTRLYELKKKGVLSEEEFQTKMKKLLKEYITKYSTK